MEIAGRAASLVEDQTAIGLGTGRAAAAFAHALAERVREGLRVRAVPTSRATEELARSLGIPLATFADTDDLDLAVDGADEVDPERNLIKGHGGALVRERVVAAAAKRFVVLVGTEKLSPRLGAKRSVPVEAIPFAAPRVSRALAALGASVRLRPEVARVPPGLLLDVVEGPFVTDNGNLIVDAAFGEIADPAALHRRIRELPGVLDTGLFCGMADLVLVEGG